MECGNRLSTAPAPTQALQWEYQDLRIPLDEMSPEDKDAYATFDAAVLAGLQAAGQQGWQADEITDWQHLTWRAKLETKKAFLGKEKWLSVKVRMKRLQR
jgi:hypothetical protein